MGRDFKLCNVDSEARDKETIDAPCCGFCGGQVMIGKVVHDGLLEEASSV